MVGKVLELILLAAATVQADYIAPVAGGYIYRKDHGSPASLIQIGTPYTKIEVPEVLGSHKLKAIEAYDLVAPAPLPYVATKPIAIEDAEEDPKSEDYVEGDLVGLDQEHVFEKGDGIDYDEEHHEAHGEKGSKGYHSKGHVAKGKTGSYDSGHKRGYYGEGKGEKGVHHDKASTHGKHYASGSGYKGGDHGHKEHFSKGEDVSGYHKVFNKDEFKKDHDFYDVADKSGHFKKHVYEKVHHGAEKGAAKKSGHHDSGFNKGGFGKAGFIAKGHIDDNDAGVSAEEGYESDYNHHEGYKKAAGRDHKKQYGYSKGGEDYDDVDKDEEYDNEE